MSRYKGQLHGGKKAKNLGNTLSTPFSGYARKKTFFLEEVFPLGLEHNTKYYTHTHKQLQYNIHELISNN